ncbi:13255_t:CDS:1 [Gigaspora rosea]|nr:13255_t:CDS:1 [Gigaspora rosea]
MPKPKLHRTKSHAFLTKKQMLEYTEQIEYMEELELENIRSELVLEKEKNKHEEEVRQLEQGIDEWLQVYLTLRRKKRN